jgi:parvulin-like peptidyl-prolyl isomerase
VIELPPSRPCLSPDDINRLIRQQGLGRPIAQAMIVDQIVRSIPLDAQESSDLVDKYLEERNISNDLTRNAYLEKEAINEDDLAWRATTARRLEIHRKRMHGPDVETRFLERKLELDKVTYSLIRVRDAELAAELYHQIRDADADFAQLAPIYSEGQERLSHGLIGPVALNAAHPEIVKRLRIGEPSQLFEPFFVVDIWLVLRLEQRVAAQLDQSMREQLEWELFDHWCQARVRTLLAGGSLMPQSEPTP